MQDLTDKLAELKKTAVNSSAAPSPHPVSLTPAAAAAAAAAASAAAVAATTLKRTPGKQPLRTREPDVNAQNTFSNCLIAKGVTTAEANGKTTPGNRKDKSLGILCQRFVQLFLISDNQIVGLDEAATELSDGAPLPSALDEDLSKEASAKILKTKVRRLYDIANVLTSLCLIEKVSLRTRKPCFRWIGANGNKALETLRGKPRHLSADTKPRPKTRSGSAGAKVALPPLKRHLSSMDAGPGLSTAATQTGKRGVKRRKAVTTAKKASAPSPNAVEEHLPSEYATMWKQFVTYAQAHGNINPLEAAAAIANATKAASAAAASSKSVAVGNARPSQLTAPDKALHFTRPSTLRHPLSSPVSTDDNASDDKQPVSVPMDVELDIAKGRTAPHAEMEAPSSPAKEIPKRDRAGSDFAHSTPKRLMAAQQLSALSRTFSRGMPDRLIEVPGPNAVCKQSPGDEADENAPIDISATAKSTVCPDQAAAEKLEAVARTPVPPSVNQSEMYRYATSQEAIDEYMNQAREAGPEYERAANEWLTSIRQWQSVWGPFSSTLKQSPSSAPSPVTPAANSTGESAARDLAEGDAESNPVIETPSKAGGGTA